MAELHIVNVSPGDCTIIRHNSGRYTVMDICGGNQKQKNEEFTLLRSLIGLAESKPSGNFRMCERTSNPIEYLKT